MEDLLEIKKNSFLNITLDLTEETCPSNRRLGTVRMRAQKSSGKDILRKAEWNVRN